MTAARRFIAQYNAGVAGELVALIKRPAVRLPAPDRNPVSQRLQHVTGRIQQIIKVLAQPTFHHCICDT
jgi:hypothetical protein